MFRRVVYIEVHRGHLICRLRGGSTRARRECAALAHPRSLFGEFQPISEAIASAIREVGAFRFGSVRPRGLVHLIPRFEGGYIDVELRAFREAAEAAGIFRPLLLDNRSDPLADTQLQEIFET